MSYVLQRMSGRSMTLSQVRGNVLRIGRGTNAELRSENPAVALEHAVIEGDANGYTITDKGSITGTYVNRRPVETARLVKGDLVEVGDLRLDVQVAEGGKPLFVRVTSSDDAAVGAVIDTGPEEVAPSAAAAAPRGGQLRAKKIDYASAYRLRRDWLTKTSIVALLLIVALFGVAQAIKPGQQRLFMPGGVSSAHATAKGGSVAKNCSNCHDAWHGVAEARCVACHQDKQAPHSDKQVFAPPCADCHGEHRGQVKLAMIADTNCVSCHGDLKGHVKPEAKTSFASITAFDEHHPDLAPQPNPDPDTLRFNHALHLGNGGVRISEKLDCKQCHGLVESKGKIVRADPMPLSFEKHCQRCHLLTFDDKFPNAEVPHGGKPGLVNGFILQIYSGNLDILNKSPEERQRILSSRPSFNVSADNVSVLRGNRVVKDKCAKCHPMAATVPITVTKPDIRTQWLQHAAFNHKQHENLDCESCHDRARRSTMTADVLMPQRSQCIDCHGPKATKSSSRCVLCHEYHEGSRGLVNQEASSGNPGVKLSGLGGGSGMFQNVLLAAIVLLLLVVLIPAGIALYSRIKAGELDKVAGVRQPAPPPAPVPVNIPPLTPQAAAPAKPAAPAPPAPATPGARTTAPAAPAVPEAGATMVGSIEAPSQGTEMVQWYGMMNCTSGPLEGQRFIVDDAGFYIGRDPALSQVVVNDNRVSKRHVRIVPRNGKVWAVDQNSLNGTFKAGQRITEVELKRGDAIVLADNAATFVYQV